MTPHGPIWTSHRRLAHAAELSGNETQAWMFDELQYVRREAQAEAELAYAAWSEQAGRDAYAVYRAAQDRADAAQDQLAVLACRSHSGVLGWPGRWRYGPSGG